MVSRLVKPAVTSIPLSLQGRRGGPNMGRPPGLLEQTQAVTDSRAPVSKSRRMYSG